MSIPTNVQVNIIDLSVFEDACIECGFKTELEGEDLVFSDNSRMMRKARVVWDESKGSYEVKMDSDDKKLIENEVIPMYSALQIVKNLENNTNFDFTNHSITKENNNNVVLEFNAVIN